MAQILVRGLDDTLVARLKERAKLNHRSLQGEVKAILEETAPVATKAEALAIVDRWQRYWEEKLRNAIDGSEVSPGASPGAIIRALEARFSKEWRERWKR